MPRFLLPAVALTLFTTVAHADSFLQIKGVLTDGGTAGGQIFVDSSGGVNFDPVSIVDGGQTYTFQGNFIQLSFGPGGVGQEVVSYDRAGNSLDFIFPLASLVGYNGGTLCSTTSPCNLSIPSSYFQPTSSASPINFTTLTATAAATPEPGSLLLLGTGVIAILSHRRLRKGAPTA